ncbi:MAG: serine/threonine-protein kinase, partial [Myxococcota bacterium]
MKTINTITDALKQTNPESMDTATRLGKYSLKRKLATGGMAEIWLAEQQGPAGFAKTLVIKRILPHLADDSKFVEMFLDEARLAAKLEHPHIVRISDLGLADGSYFIAMEFIDGPDLDYIIERAEQLGTRVPLPIAARIMADSLAGLEFAHTFVDEQGNPMNLVHRDISPHNILVNRAGVSKIVDFGVAKAASSTHKTQTGAIKGKFAYMSPEQIANNPLDGRSDVFAMGI